MPNISTRTRVIAGCADTQLRASYICAGGIVNLSARPVSHATVVKKLIVIDEAACCESNGSLQVEPPGREIFRCKTAPVFSVFVP